MRKNKDRVQVKEIPLWRIPSSALEKKTWLTVRKKSLIDSMLLICSAHVLVPETKCARMPAVTTGLLFRFGRTDSETDAKSQKTSQFKSVTVGREGVLTTLAPFMNQIEFSPLRA